MQEEAEVVVTVVAKVPLLVWVVMLVVRNIIVVVQAAIMQHFQLC